MNPIQEILSDRDGRDPKRYASLAWTIVGKHDRAWSDRPVYRKIRYMPMASTGRKVSIRRPISSKSRSGRNAVVEREI
jgi:deoxyribodipyrimidine photo-lyase